MFQCDLLTTMEETQGIRLKRLRKNLGMTQTALAKKAGVQQGQIGNIETDMRNYGVSVVSIAQALNTSPDYLLLKTDDPAPQVDPLQRAVDTASPKASPIAEPSALALTLAQWFDTIPEEARMAAHVAITQVIIGAKLAQAEDQPTPDKVKARKSGKQHA